jgi:ABC-type oligopeptide transport system ATPase subunit
MSQTAHSEPPETLEKETVEAQIIKREIWDRMWLDNEHFMGVLVGREGSGKSWTGMKLAEVCDPTFEGWRVMFDPANFLKQLQEWKEQNRTRGKMVVIDEAGVGVGVRSWYEKDQILLNQVLQLIRDENMGVIFTLPRLEELDSQTEGRLHAFMQMTDKDPGNWAKFKYFEWDPTRDGRNDTYREYPYLTVNGYERQIKRLTVGPPSQEIVEPYEERKNEFQSQQYQNAIDEREDDVDDEKTVKEIAMEIADGNIEPNVS